MSSRIGDDGCWEYWPTNSPRNGIVHGKIVHTFKLGPLIHYVFLDASGDLHVRPEGSFYRPADLGTFASPDDALRDASDRHAMALEDADK